MAAKEPQSLSLKRLLRKMESQDASDLYVTAGFPPAYRTKGAVRPIKHPALSPVQCEQLANSCMSEKQRAEFSATYEMNLALSYPGIGRFRVNVLRQRGSVAMVVRTIPTEVPSMEKLNLPEIFKEIVLEKNGVIIMVGATSSGKSTSMAAMIDYRNRTTEGHIITIEDPVEFIHPHKKCVVTQREVGTDTLTFQHALKNTLRQAPDVILVGEIRDRETMEHALEFAETGHLCLATMHANNANQALERVINFFPEELHTQVNMNLAMNVRAILSQRLAKTLSGGRAAAIEILINTPRISDLIMKGRADDIKETMEAGGNYGMQTFDQHLLRLWREKKISEEEALRLADSLNDLRLKIKMAKLETEGDDDSLDGLTSGDSGGVGGSELKI
ncbi:MAG: PilT/PilU family type 4a pilus ATPase [Mariprofundales bacterium]